MDLLITAPPEFSQITVFLVFFFVFVFLCEISGKKAVTSADESQGLTFSHAFTDPSQQDWNFASMIIC